MTLNKGLNIFKKFKNSLKSDNSQKIVSKKVN